MTQKKNKFGVSQQTRGGMFLERSTRAVPGPFWHQSREKQPECSLFKQFLELIYVL